MRMLILAAALAFSAQVAADQTVGAFRDPLRGLTIYEHNWHAQLAERWSAFGFNELYREPAQGFPADSTVLFGKTWVMRDVGHGVSVGLELEHGYNNAGMWTRGRPFVPDQFRVLPKFGIQVRLP